MGEPVRVSAFVKATVQDAPYLGVIVPHMFAQARFPFDERLVVVDRPRGFRGKYKARSIPDGRLLDGVLAKLVEDGEIDRVLEVDYAAEARTRILGSYFAGGGKALATHARTGGPIYTTLFGLEAARNDLVLQYDADMLFHAEGGSWVALALEVMGQDPRVWAMMTHGGPPTGRVDELTSLGARNARRAIWDATLRIWKFRTLSTRYFLCDRRRFRGALAAPATGGCPPLEQCMSHAMQRNNAWRGCVAMSGSWDLHVHNHAHPFPQWAPELVKAVERGRFPAMQAGRYDLRLDQDTSRRAWRQLLDTLAHEAVSQAVHARRKPQAVSNTTEKRAATNGQISVVIPVRNRSGVRVQRSLASLAWQSHVAREVIVVSYASDPRTNAALAEDCRTFGARLICAANEEDLWCKPRALNIGIRAAADSADHLMTMDVDMILAPDFLHVVVGVLRNRKAFVMCQSRDLPRDCALPCDVQTLKTRFDSLRKGARLRGKYGTGGIQAASRQFFYDVRGYDEDLVWWGAEDGDMAMRAAASGLAHSWITERTAMLHQWHPKRHKLLHSEQQKRAAGVAWQRNHRLVQARRHRVLRNDEHWGLEKGT